MDCFSDKDRRADAANKRYSIIYGERYGDDRVIYYGRYVDEGIYA
jgi:hypothetical protein